MITTRDVQGIVRRIDGTPWGGVRVQFTLDRSTWDGDALYPRDAKSVLSGADGRFTATLWTNSLAALPVRYVVTWPGRSASFVLAPGDGPIDITEVLTGALPAHTPVGAATVADVVNAAVARHNADAFAHPGLGGGGASVALAALAGQTLGGHRGVWCDAQGRAWYANATNDSAERVAGVTLHAADVGGTIAVQSAGEITEAGWNWQPGPVFLGTNGMLTQTPAANAALVQIGIASRATALIVRIGIPFFSVAL